MTEAIKAWDYWPNVPTNKIFKFHYKDVGPQPDTTNPTRMPDMHSWFVNDKSSSSLLYVDYDQNMKWKDTWYLQHRPGYGIAEWRDDNIVEKDTIATKIFGKRNKVVFKYDSPIWWGDVCELGKYYSNSPKSNFFSCLPPQSLSGHQSFVYDKKLDTFTTNNGMVYKDVVTLIYQQSWNSNIVGGARYWMAKGIGPVAVQWVSVIVDKSQIVVTNRMDATFEIENGSVKDIQI